MRGKYWIVIGVAAMGWGTGGISTRAAYDEGVGIWTMVAIRAAIAAAVVIAILAARRMSVPSPRVLRIGFMQAIFNLTVPYFFFTAALDHASAGFIGVLTALIPLSTAGFAHFMLTSERLTPRRVVALVVGFGGIVVLMATGASGLSSGGNPMAAIGLGCIAVVSASFAGTHAKKHTGEYDPMMLAAIQFGLASVWLVGIMFAAEGAPTDVSAKGWWLILAMGILATAMPFLLFFWVLQFVAATDASLVAYIVPFVALIGGAVLLDEQLQSGILLAGACVGVGVYFSDRESRRLERLGAGVA